MGFLGELFKLSKYKNVTFQFQQDAGFECFHSSALERSQVFSVKLTSKVSYDNLQLFSNSPPGHRNFQFQREYYKLIKQKFEVKTQLLVQNLGGLFWLVRCFKYQNQYYQDRCEVKKNIQMKIYDLYLVYKLSTKLLIR